MFLKATWAAFCLVCLLSTEFFFFLIQLEKLGKRHQQTFHQRERYRWQISTWRVSTSLVTRETKVKSKEILLHTCQW